MAAFVIKQLEKILARKELKWKNHEKLKNEVTKALDSVKNASKSIDENAAFRILPESNLPKAAVEVDSNLKIDDTSEIGGTSTVGSTAGLVDGAMPEQTSSPIPPELYLVALLQSCKSGIPQVQTLALDSIQKLMLFGHISGDETPAGLRRAELVISFVCDSFKGTGSDEQVSLQLLKVLLTAVQANNFAVHGQTLLLAIKTAYNIALASKSMVNQATARATLTQTVNFLFSKMEAEAIEMDFKPIPDLGKKSSSSVSEENSEEPENSKEPENSREPEIEESSRTEQEDEVQKPEEPTVNSQNDGNVN